jgi:hypothetical protein
MGNDECVGIAIVAAIYIGAVVLFFQYIFVPVLYIASLIMAVYILSNFSKACIKCFKGQLPGASEDKPSGDQPAFKQYFFKKAYIDLRDITIENYKLNKESIKQFINTIKSKFFNEGATWATWPVGLAAFMAVPVAILVGVGIYLTVTFFHVMIVLSSAISIFITSMIFIGIENINMARWRIFFACPNCYDKFSMPIYFCPTCNAKHTKLVPGQYGITKRKCECGTLLPTLFFNGKNELLKNCPKCNHQLSSETGMAINVHYPIVGGQSTGKSSFLVASMITLREMSEEEGFSLTFPKEDRVKFEKFETDFKTGIAMNKTVVQDKPRAFLLNIDTKVDKKPPHLIYMYDAAGEIFENMDSLRLHKYFEYISGIFFLIDPFSIHVIRRKYESELLNYSKNIGPSKEKLQDIYDRMIINLGEHKENRKIFFSDGKYKIPIAVVITKSDAFDLDNTIKNINSDNMELENQIDNDITSNQIRDWLYNIGEDNFIRGVESTFANVKYFSCSALGRMPNEISNKEFVPKNVESIIKWMFSFRKIIN